MRPFFLSFFRVVKCPMSSEELVKVGKIKDAHSLKGEVYFLSFSGDISWLDEGFTVVLESQATMKREEFVVSRFRPFKDGAIIKFEGIDNRNQSEALKGEMVFIEPENFESSDGETIFLREVLNFEIKNENGDSLGTVTSFSSNGSQDLLVINNGTFSYEVPFVEDYIIEVQFENSVIVMDFPMDLMDINRVI